MIYTKYNLSLIKFLQFLIVWTSKLNKKNGQKSNQKNFVITFLKQIFTWWHRQTVGTFIYTLFTGKFIGNDEFGNKFYTNSSGKRWVVYKNDIESSKIPPDWHSWIHFKIKKAPTNNEKKFSWQQQYEENLTGTKKAHRPEGSLASDLKKNMKKYETWNP